MSAPKTILCSILALMLLSLLTVGCTDNSNSTHTDAGSTVADPPAELGITTCEQLASVSVMDQFHKGKLEMNPDSITTLHLNGEYDRVKLPELKNLRRVVVYDCTPPFSLDFLTNAPCLDTLDINACEDVAGLDIPFAELSDLENLSIRNSGNIPDEIFACTGLKLLSLTQFEGFDPVVLDWSGLGNLRDLAVLEVIKSNLGELDPLLQNAKNLREVAIVDAQITEISDAICALKKLKVLDLKENEIGQLPDCVKDIAEL